MADYRELAKQAAQAEGLDPDLFLKVVGTESNFNPRALSPKGAQGLTQLMPATAKELGVLDAFDPVQNLAGGAKYLRQKLDANNGDARLALAAYNWGQGNLNKQGIDKAPEETRNYIAKILGEGYVPTARAVDNKIAAKATALPDTEAVRASMQNQPVDTAAVPRALTIEREAKETAEANRPTGWEMFGAAVAGNTDARLIRGFSEQLFGEQYKRDPNFTPDLTKLVLPSRELVEEVKLARNATEQEAIMRRADDEAFRQKTVMDRGMPMGIALSFAGEFTSLSNWIPGVVATKTLAAFGVGSQALALQGRTAASLGSAVGENLIAGTTVEALAQSLNNEYHPGDLFLAAGVDTIFGVGFGALGLRAAGKAAAEAASNNAARIEVQRELVRIEAATQKLGPDATADQIVAEARRMATSEATTPVRDSVTAINEKRKLMEHPDDLAAKAEAAEAKPQGDRASVSAKPATDAAASWGALSNEAVMVARRERFAPGGVDEAQISLRTGGTVRTLQELEGLPAGVHMSETIPVAGRPAMDAAVAIARKFLGDATITIHADDLLADGKAFRGDIVQVSDKAAMVRVNKNLGPTDMLRSTVHELGHAIMNKNLAKLDNAMLSKLDDAYQRFRTLANAGPSGSAARSERFSLLNSEIMPEREFTTPLKGDYNLSRDEYGAEQFVKFLEEDAATANKVGLPAQVVSALKGAIRQVLEFLRLVKRENVGVTDEYRELFEMLAAGSGPRGDARIAADSAVPLAQADAPANAAKSVDAFMTNPDAQRFGLTHLPVGTASERADAKAVLDLHIKAEAWAVRNPKDAAWEARVKNLSDNNVFNVASTGLLLLKSDSPVARMVASELLEDASGAAGTRNSTAAISKYMHERLIQGNAVNDVQASFESWKKARDYGIKDDYFGGKNWDRFNREVAEEIEARRANGDKVSKDGNVLSAADSLEAAYTRAAKAQKENKTLGWQALPESSVGYMPHRMSPKHVWALTNEKRQIVHDALVDQFVTIEGWDISFSDQLASRYLERVRDRASGGYTTPIGGGNSGSAEIIEQALLSMDLPADEVRKQMMAFNKGAAGWTKGRIEMDLNRTYDTADGPFKLMDIFETNQLELLRAQTQRASGEIALARHGVYGKPGLGLLRKAMNNGMDGQRANAKELEAFDQVSAEFLGAPFGKTAGVFMERAMLANSVVRLGGIVFNQFAESLNGIMHVGAVRTLESAAGIGRLRGEIIALARGEKVDNPFLSSIELVGGAEFGTDSYKMVMPFDSPDHAFPTYGRDTLTATDRLLRGASHVQAKLSGWRLIHSAQQRGMAEQIVHKMARYVRDGNEDIALRQFGITPEVQAALRADLPNVATFEGNRLTSFDVTKITDPDIREQVIQSVHRGTQQIIQGTFIGERGKWAHDGWMKALTQFRTFGITSMEKQWGRQRNSRGTAAAMGIVVGSMTLAAPIYMARVYANSIGRPDQEEYLDKNLQFEKIARSTLNYIALSGMAGDFIDATSSVLPEGLGVKPTGGRAGVASDFVGNYVLPASSLVDDVWKYAQDVDNLEKAAKLLPGSRIPYLLPALNATGD